MKKTKRARRQRRGRVSIRWKTLSVLGVFALTMIGLLWLFQIVLLDDFYIAIKKNAVSKALEEQGVQVKGSETTMVPTTPTEVSGADAKKVQRLIDRLEELDDVQDVYSTMDMTDEVIAALEEE